MHALDEVVPAVSEAAVQLPWPEPDTGGAIAALLRYGDEVRAESLARAERRLRALSPEARRVVETLAARIVDEFLLGPSLRLREAAVSPEGLVYARVVAGLFAPEDRL